MMILISGRGENPIGWGQDESDGLRGASTGTIESDWT
jgi:hypothetical protein